MFGNCKYFSLNLVIVRSDKALCKRKVKGLAGTDYLHSAAVGKIQYSNPVQNPVQVHPQVIVLPGIHAG